MGSVLVDNEWLELVVPDGFQPIDHDDLMAIMGLDYDCMWGLRNDERHIVAAFTWKDSNKLLSKLVSEKSVAGQVDESFARRYRKNDYRAGVHFERSVAGASGQAHGFSFTYSVQGIAHSGEILVFKRGIRCYTLYYYTQTGLVKDNRPIYEAIVDSFRVL